MVGFYDGLSYHQFDSINHFLDHTLTKNFRSYVIYAHNGGKFDFLFLFEELKRRNRQVKLCMQGARIVQIKVQVSDRWITFRDSFSILPYALQYLSDSFRPDHAKFTGTINFETEIVSKDNADHRRYLEHDCKSLYEIIEKYMEMPFIRDVGLKLTQASTALAAFRTTMRKDIIVSSMRTQNFVRKAYAGGRCEIFRQTLTDGACYDVNSLYPHAMLQPMPIEAVGRSHSIDDFGFHDVTVHVPEMFVPPLWVKTDKLIFPCGTFRGVYFSEELKAAVNMGATILEHHEGQKFTQDTDLFGEFVRTCYELRLNHPDSAISLVAKGLMNNCYGKFAERELKQSLLMIDPDDVSTWPKGGWKPVANEKVYKKWGLVTQEISRRSPHMMVHIAAAVTAYGRIKMLKNYQFDEKLAYTDTDSVFGKVRPVNSKVLGELKQEYLVSDAYFLLPKAYWVQKSDGEIIRKIKGFRKKDLLKLTRSEFKSGKISTVNNQMLTFRAALLRSGTSLTLGEIKKSIKSGYSKRRLLPCGSSEAWVIKQGVIKNAKEVKHANLRY